jgi:hypothetical protein
MIVYLYNYILYFNFIDYLHLYIIIMAGIVMFLIDFYNSIIEQLLSISFNILNVDVIIFFFSV